MANIDYSQEFNFFLENSSFEIETFPWYRKIINWIKGDQDA